MLDYEVGGGEGYYNKFLKRPTWPGGASGVTVAIGYDLGYNSKSVILSDWRNLKEKERLADVAGFKGSSAKAKVAQVRDILVDWNLAEGVFNSVTIPRFWLLARSAFPGFDELNPNAQAALLSIAFNRGTSMAGPGRIEMREIARLSPKKDYKGMAAQIRLMKRLWIGKGLDGLLARRESEAKLMESAR